MSTMIDVPASGAASTDMEAPNPPACEDWITRPTAAGAVRDAAIAELHELMPRAAHRQVFRMAQAAQLGRARCDEIAQGAADEAAVSVLARLERFEGRSRFTTWALVVHGQALNATFRAHLRSCASCHEEARTLVELAAQNAGADPIALLDRLEIEVAGYPPAR